MSLHNENCKCDNFSDNILVGNSEIAYYGPELEINIDSQTVQFCNKVTLYTIFTRFDSYVIIFFISTSYGYVDCCEGSHWSVSFP